MKNALRRRCALAATALLLIAGLSSADEIWVAPGAPTADAEVGSWAVTAKGETHFSFAIPDDLSSFQGARVVVISGEDTDARYDLFFSLSRDGFPQDVYSDRRLGLGPATLFRNQLQEIDVSEVFPDLAPGTDVATLRLRVRGWRHGERHEEHGHGPKGIRVVGLRFQYASDVFLDGTTGNVGIGTTTPRTKLEVAGTVAASAFASTSPLILEAPAGVERARIDDVTGDVGIGTASPAAKLDVAGDVAVGGATVIDASGHWVGDPTGLVGPPGPPGAPGTALAYARVLADGTVEHDSGNIAVSHVGSGSYCIGVSGGTPPRVAVASLDSLYNVGGSVQTGVFHASACTASGNNDIYVVTRSHSQDGGLPGSDRAFYIIVN